MEIGFIGLGKMGLEMSSRAVQAGHRLVGYDNSPQARENAEGRGIPLFTGQTAPLQSAPRP